MGKAGCSPALSPPQSDTVRQGSHMSPPPPPICRTPRPVIVILVPLDHLPVWRIPRSAIGSDSQTTSTCLMQFIWLRSQTRKSGRNRHRLGKAPACGWKPYQCKCRLLERRPIIERFLVIAHGDWTGAWDGMVGRSAAAVERSIPERRDCPTSVRDWTID